MRICRALPIAVALSFAVAATAPAQELQPPPAQEPPCLAQFVKLRGEAEKKAAAIKAASERHATAQEACRLFNAFSAAEAKMIKYAVDSGVWCGIPDQALAEMKKAHEHTETLRAKICQVAAAPPRPAGPSLSESLSAPVPNAGNIKTGHGTFDTLTGAPLGLR
ncbi:MAG: hypothetical protein IRY89_06640 [Pseudolabrys sp.]|nr:hypothetical protein [Pseudolabrys sp.]